MTTQKRQSVILHPRDNVAVAIYELRAGEKLDVVDIPVKSDIPSGHKAAITHIRKGEAILKYGQIIGFASEDIEAGYHVHINNVYLEKRDHAYSIGTATTPTNLIPEHERRTFDGYMRPSGRVGTRNFLGIISTVSCSGDVSQFIAESIEKKLLSQYPSVDGVVALTHGSGCCLAPNSEGLQLLQRTLKGYAENPNFGGMLVVGLGCETNRIEDFLTATGLAEDTIFQTLSIQDTGGTLATIEAGLGAASSMLPKVAENFRVTVSADNLVVALECGGSDAYSGITANPALGEAVDLVVKNGGTAILSETPEIYGAEHLLIERAVSEEVGMKLSERIKWWERYTSIHGAKINNNPTPGNKAGGITTILEKSLGAVAKAGSTNLNGVYEYAETIRNKGLVFMDSPGYDVVSITGMIASGANLVCFSTGRGTVCGFRPVPTIKLASNSEMYRHLQGDMDINCGDVLDGAASIQEKGTQIFEEMLETASGKKTKSEKLGFGGTEFVPWQIGAIL